MIYFYFPGKPVPEWLEEIRFEKAQENLNPYVAHGGFGFVFKRGSVFNVIGISGNFITFRNCNDVKITGGEGGVYYRDLSFVIKGFFTRKPMENK